MGSHLENISFSSQMYIKVLVSQYIAYLPLQACIYHCHLHPLQTAKCCHSELVVDEDDLKWEGGGQNGHVLVKQFRGHFPSKPLGCRKIKYVFRYIK